MEGSVQGRGGRRERRGEKREKEGGEERERGGGRECHMRNISNTSRGQGYDNTH